MKNIRISGAVITLNEEQYIERMLKNLRQHVDEMIVLDSGSEDSTIEIAQKYDCKTYHRDFENHYADQRNYALDKCSGQWILFLDADEYFENSFYEKLSELLQQDEYDAFEVLRHNIFYTKIKNPIKRWYNYKKSGYEYQIKLFQSHCRYQGRLHEKPHGIKKLGRLNDILIHDKSIERQKYNNWHYNFIRKKRNFHPNARAAEYNPLKREKK